MKPILYPSNEKRFENNGIGVLSDAISCVVTWEGNGIFDLTMEYPIDGVFFDKITDRCIILAIPTPYDPPQPFRVSRITKTLSGTVEICAQHVAYDLSGVPLNPFTAGSAQEAMTGIGLNVETGSEFTFWTNKTTVADFSVLLPTSVWSILGGAEGSLLDVYGGQFVFDRWAVKLYNEYGRDKGVTIRYGKNLIDLEQEQNLSKLYTGVYPYWSGSEGNIITCDPKIVPVPGTFDYTNVLVLDLSSDFESAPTEEQLRDRTEQYIKNNNIGKPTVSITVSHEMLEQTDEYSGLAEIESCRVFDTVSVIFEKLGIDAKAEIVSAETDVLLDRYNSLKIGNIRANIADTIVDQQHQIDNITKNPVQSSAFKNAVASLTQSILGAKGGSVRLLDSDNDGEPDTLYIADDPDPLKSKKVWRFNYEGWGASENGYNGPFKIGATLNDGLVADFITTGTLNGDLVRTGTIQSPNGRMTINLDQGRFSTWGISTLTGEEIIFNFNNGTITQMQGNLKSGEWYNDNNVGILATGQVDAYGINILRDFDIDNKTDSNRTTIAYHDESFGNRITLAGEAFRIWMDTTGSGRSRVFAYVSGREMTIETDVLYVEGQKYKPITINVGGQEYKVLGV